MLLLLWPCWGQQPPATPPLPPTPGPTPIPPTESELNPTIQQPEQSPPTTPTVPRGRIRISALRQILSPEAQIYQFIGDVTVETSEVTIHAAEVTYEGARNLLTARGNVSVRETGKTVTYWGNTLEYNAQTRAWRFLDWATELPPGYLGQQFIGPIFVNGRNVTGATDLIRAGNARVTTCDLPNPHYYFNAKRVDIFPGDKLIAYHNNIFVLGQRVFYWPWIFLSLRENRTPITPEFGRNETEGYYAKVLFPYAIDRNNVGGVRTDITEKLGTGVGIRHFYNLVPANTVFNGNGQVFAYGRRELDEYTISGRHRQNLPYSITTDLTGDFRQNSYLTTQQTTSTNISTVVARHTTNSDTNFNFTRHLNEGTFSTDNASASLSASGRTRFGNLNYDATYTNYRSTSTDDADEEMWNRVKYLYNLKVAELHVEADKHSALGGLPLTQPNVFPGTQRLPEVYLTSNLSQGRLFNLIPSQFRAGWGVFDEQQNDTSGAVTRLTLSRYQASWRSTPRLNLKKYLSLTGQTDFRQTVYGDSDTTALYSAGGNVSALLRVGIFTNTLTYAKQTSDGFTPFRFDTVYPSETANESLNLQYFNPITNRSANVYLSTGRDLENARWQDLQLRGDFWTSRRFFTQHRLAFDLESNQWRDLQSQFSWLFPPRLRFNLNTWYALEEQRLRQATSNLEWQITPQWRLAWLGGYNGIDNEFIYDEFLLTRDLHCWDVSLHFSEQNKSGYIYFRLKALNAPLPSFGFGKGGNALGTNPGTIF
jgi:hypothetical protein